MYTIKIKSLIDYGPGIGLTKDKIYDACDCGKGWFAFIDDCGEEYAYPPHLFEVVGTANPALTELREKDFDIRLAE